MLIKLILHTPLLGLVLGPIVTWLGDELHKLWRWLDQQPPIAKQAAAVVLSMLLIGVTQLVPGAVPAECANVAATGIGDACQSALASGPFLQAVVTALVAIAVKHGKQR